MLNIEQAQKFLGGYAELFDFTVREGYVIVKPKNRIDKKDFSDIGKLVKQENGEYVKFDYGTKEGGYFRFKADVSTATNDKVVTTFPPHDKRNLLIKDAVAYAETVRTQLGYFIEKLKELQK